MANRALLVGINVYKMAGADLKGCVNDVTNIRDILLKYFDFSARNVRLLINDRATKKNILDRLEWLVGKAKAQDRLLFHFSGHGSQILDRDGDELKDKKDEILCPHDMDWDGTFITDDDLGRIFSSLTTGAKLDVFLDSCHSGTGTRELRAISGLPEEIQFIARYLEPPADVAARCDDDDMEIRRLLRENNLSDHVLMSGCRDNQTSADANIGGSYNGAFTYYLCKHLRDTQGDITRHNLTKRVRASLRFNGFSQIPQLEASKERKNKKILE